MTRGSSLSGSAKPFLKLLMPLPKSPIRSETLPRPPNSTNATSARSNQWIQLQPPRTNPPNPRRVNGPPPAPCPAYPSVKPRPRGLTQGHPQIKANSQAMHEVNEPRTLADEYLPSPVHDLG